MREQTEILAQIEKWAKEDFFGVMARDLAGCLTYENAKPMLKPEITADDWTYYTADEEVKAQMLDYMPFAWDKANDCRGLSAARSMMHYRAWIWLLGDDETLGALDDYEYYGKDNLARICKHYGWDHSQWDDGRRVNSESED